MVTATAPRSLRDISTQLGEHESVLRRSLYGALMRAVASDVSERLRVLDIGAGRGELMELLQARGHEPVGLDVEEECVALCQRFGRAERGGFGDLDQLFQPDEFDVVISSHVLEHVDNPRECLKSARRLNARRYVFAVPNVHRCARLVRLMLGNARADHPTHFFGWGRPEFAALLSACGYRITRWHVDRVTVNPLSGKAGATLGRILSPLETRLLPRLAPLLSSSLIAECVPVPPAKPAADEQC